MQHVRSASKSFVANKPRVVIDLSTPSPAALNDTLGDTLIDEWQQPTTDSNVVRLFSSRELGKRFNCLPAEVEKELVQHGMSYHKNSGGLLWEVPALS